MSLGRYVLADDGTPRRVEDDLEWTRWHAGADEVRRVAYDAVGDGVVVSTVFLGLDHNHSGEGPPVLWETAVFAADHEVKSIHRYSDRESALAGHKIQSWRTEYQEILKAEDWDLRRSALWRDRSTTLAIVSLTQMLSSLFWKPDLLPWAYSVAALSLIAWGVCWFHYNPRHTKRMRHLKEIDDLIEPLIKDEAQRLAADLPDPD